MQQKAFMVFVNDCEHLVPLPRHLYDIALGHATRGQGSPRTLSASHEGLTRAKVLASYDPSNDGALICRRPMDLP
jgi:hypothetical protein